MRAWMLAFCGGVMLAGRLPQLPPVPIILMSCLLVPLLCRWRRCRIAAAALAGACWLFCWGQSALANRFPAHDTTLDLLVQGRVTSVPVPTEQGWRLRFRIEARCDSAGICTALDRQQQRTVLVSIYEQLALVPGQRWQWLLRLRRPHGFFNPGGFDQEAWLLQQGIAATGYLRSSGFNRQLAAAAGQPRFERLRQALAARMQSRPEQPYLQAGLMKALALGLHQDIPDSYWRQFTQLGLNHLVVISGLHVALVAGVLYRLGLLLARSSTTLLLGLTAPRFAACWALAGAWFYSGLAGFTLPVLRSLVMVAVYFSGTLLQRQTSAVASLLLALLLVLLLDPLAPQAPGFWLSFVAVALLLRLGDSSTTGMLQWFLHTVRLQVLLCIAMLPLMLVFFQQSSLLAPLANLPAVPWVGLLAVPLCLAGLALQPLWPQAGDLLLRLTDFLLDCFMQAVTGALQLWPDALWTMPPLSLPRLLGFLVIALCFLPGMARRWRLGGLLLLPLVLLWPAARLRPGELQLTVLDVGQGLAVLVRTRHHNLLYDAGPRYSARFDAGEDVLLPALRRLGVQRLDTVIVSHADMDHAGGIAAIVEQFPEAHYIGPALAAFTPGTEASRCRPQQWRSDGYRFALLHPDEGRYDDNDGSCVLHISGAGGSVLLPGDISRRIEHRLLQQYPALRADLLLAPHHGSKTSSSAAFIRALQPRVVVFSSGYLNRFRHPAQEVQERYAAAGVQSFDTASAGAVLAELGNNPGELRVSSFRTQRRRFWHGAAEAGFP